MNPEETLPPGYSRAEREKLRPWAIVAVVAGLVALCLALSGCAAGALPKCPDARYVQIEQGGEKYTVFDSANWGRAMETLRGLRDRSCEIPTAPAAAPAPEQPRGTGPTSTT